MPARASRQPIYISISDEGKKVLSGRYNFHGLKNRAAVFIRDGAKVDGYEDLHPIYLAYYRCKQEWFLQSSEKFLTGQTGGLMALITTGSWIF